jgi:Tol biopolymer transport system component/DNA-binding winged helix-turn-helix (wHTH) protein
LLKEHEVYKFGEFTLDPIAKVVFRDGQPVHLTRKAVETLQVLVENSGQVLTKEEIMSAVWGGRIVDEANLTQNIAVIRKALGAAQGTPAHIETFAGRGYRLEGPVACSVLQATIGQATPPGQQGPDAVPQQPTRSRLLWPGLGLAAAVLVVSAGVLLRFETPPRDTQFRVTPVTRMHGKEFQPALSPDGSRLVFLWSQDGTAPPSIWMKETAGGSPVKLTGIEGHCSSPAWSPDGRRVAYLRIGKDSTEILEKGTDSREERRIAALSPPNYGLDNRLIAWSPEGKTLVVAHSDTADRQPGLVAIDTMTGQSRRLTRPSADSADVDPRFSPDGSFISFVRIYHRSHQELFVLPAQGGEPRQLTRFNGQISSHDWSRDGHLVFASNHSGEFRLWRTRLRAAGQQPRLPLPPWAEAAASMIGLNSDVPFSGGIESPKPIAVYGDFPIQISIATRSDVLVYSSLNQDRNVWRLDLMKKAWDRIAASSGQDASPQYSPQGDRISFRSDRSGDEQLWVAAADGSNPRQITQGKVKPSVGRWAPDGGSVVFNNPLTGEIFRASTREPANLSAAGANGIHPVFSPDGRWIYAGGQLGIVRIPSGGGPGIPISQVKSESLNVSPDGRFLFYVREPNDTTLWRLTLETGESTKVLDNLVPGCTSCWALAASGVYYLGTDRGSFDAQVLYYRDWKSGADRVVIRYPEPLWPQGSGPFSLSPDGRYLLCVRVDPSNSDVLLVSPFR